MKYKLHFSYKSEKYQVNRKEMPSKSQKIPSKSGKQLAFRNLSHDGDNMLSCYYYGIGCGIILSDPVYKYFLLNQ